MTTRADRDSSVRAPGNTPGIPGPREESAAREAVVTEAFLFQDSFHEDCAVRRSVGQRRHGEIDPFPVLFHGNASAVRQLEHVNGLIRHKLRSDFLAGFGVKRRILPAVFPFDDEMNRGGELFRAELVHDSGTKVRGFRIEAAGGEMPGCPALSVPGPDSRKPRPGP